MAIDFYTIGLVGFVNLAILTLIVFWRTARWYNSWEGPHTFESNTFRKKLAFHVLLMFATSLDIPLYISFFIVEEYTLVTYSFHKFSSAFLLAALSITISDWAAVLHDIHEYKNYPWIFGRSGLFTVNGIYFAISFVNFVFCYVSDSVDDYTHSPLYVATIFLQIFISILLTCLMLHAGLKLYNRIQGAAGNLDPSDGSGSRRRQGTATSTSNNSARSRPPSSRSQFANQFDGSAEFRGALRNLNLVMATCTFCMLLQMVMMILNYALGYANSTTKTVGPALIYWVLLYWIPMWGPVLSLLYLCRTHSNRKKARFNTMRIHSTDPGMSALRSPLIDGAMDLSLSGDAMLSQSDDRTRQLLHQDSASDGQFLSGGNSVLQAILASQQMEQGRTSNQSNRTGSSQQHSSRGQVSNRTMGRRSSEMDNFPPAQGEGGESDSDTESGTHSQSQSRQSMMEEDSHLSMDYLSSPDHSVLYNMYAHSPFGISPPQQTPGLAKDNASATTSNNTYDDPEDPMRDTTTTLPSELYFPQFAAGLNNQDFSYRGGDDHNGHFN